MAIAMTIMAVSGLSIGAVRSSFSALVATHFVEFVLTYDSPNGRETT
jgi:hypothetical protein